MADKQLQENKRQCLIQQNKNTDNIITKQTVFLCCVVELIMMFALPIAQPREGADPLSCIADLNEC